MSVGMFGEDFYAFVYLCGRMNGTRYYPITKEEHDTCRLWWDYHIGGTEKGGRFGVDGYMVPATDKMIEIMERGALKVQYDGIGYYCEN
jgi:hypothetical protein